MQEEISLVDLLKRKDEQAFCFVYNQYAPALYGCILRLVRDSGTAGNILQESFVRIFRTIELYPQQKNRLFTWMLQIALQQCREVVPGLTNAAIKNELATGMIKQKRQPQEQAVTVASS